MSRLKYDQTPGKPRGRGYFPQLEGVARAIDSLPRAFPDVTLRTESEVLELRAKQAAKLARRAARAGA